MGLMYSGATLNRHEARGPRGRAPLRDHKNKTRVSRTLE
jgi:hypothetical protein